MDGVFYRGETWELTGLVRKRDGNPLDMTNGSVELRFVKDGERLMLKTEATVEEGGAGIYTFKLDPGDQQDAFEDGYCFLEVDAIDANGNITVQNSVLIEIRTSQKHNFP